MIPKNRNKRSLYQYQYQYGELRVNSWKTGAPVCDCWEESLHINIILLDDWIQWGSKNNTNKTEESLQKHKSSSIISIDWKPGTQDQAFKGRVEETVTNSEGGSVITDWYYQSATNNTQFSLETLHITVSFCPSWFGWTAGKAWLRSQAWCVDGARLTWRLEVTKNTPGRDQETLQSPPTHSNKCFRCFCPIICWISASNHKKKKKREAC